MALRSRCTALLVAVVLILGTCSEVAADEDTCDGCTDYQSYDDKDEGHGHCAGDGQYLPQTTLENLLQDKPDVQEVVAECYGEPEELCSLLFYIERHFNATLRNTAINNKVSAAPETKYYASIQEAIARLKSNKHVDAHATLERVRNETVAFAPSSSNAFQLLTTALPIITSYFAGDGNSSRRLLDEAIVVGQKYGKSIASAQTATSTNAQKLHTSFRQLMAALLFTKSKLHVEDGKWSEGAHVAAEAAQWSNGTAFLYEWRGRLHEQLNETADYIRMWKHALVLNPAVRDRFVWPIYCLANRLREAVLLANSTTQSANVAVEQDHLFATMPRITAEQAFVSNLAEGASLASALDSARVGGMADDFYRSPNLDQAAVPKDARYATLLAFVKHVRSMECSDAFIHFRNGALHDLQQTPAVQSVRVGQNTSNDEASDHTARNARAQHYSWSNFAYGQIYYTGFGRLFQRPALRDQLQQASSHGLDIVVLGSNIGIESSFFALTHPDVQVYGYDLLCAFVDRARELQERFDIENVQFSCADALTADLSNAALVFIDNQAWDAPLVSKIWQKIQNEAPIGTLVIEFAAADYYSGIVPTVTMQIEMCSSMDVSWSPFAGTHVAVFRKGTGSGASAGYHDFNEFSNALLKMMDISSKLVAQLSDAVVSDQPPQWCHHRGLSEFVEGYSDCTLPSDSTEQLEPYFPSASVVEDLRSKARESPVLLTTAKFSDSVVQTFQRVLLKWHMEKFWCQSTCVAHNFTTSEVRYLHKYLALSGNEFRNFALTGQWVGNRMSSYSYSHRFKGVDGDKTEEHNSADEAGVLDNPIAAAAPTPLRVDSARFRVGTTSQEHLLLGPALNVLAERGITPPADLCTRDVAASEETGVPVCSSEEAATHGGAFIFYGFGWDMAADAFKVYYMFHGLSSVPTELLRAAGIDDTNFPDENDLMAYGLLSYTYSNRDNSVIESKIYVYPKTAKEALKLGIKLPSKYVSTVAVMFSDQRGTVAQFDMEQVWACIWRSELSVEGRAVMDSYMDVGMNLETLTFAGNDSYTLYFPSGSG